MTAKTVQDYLPRRARVSPPVLAPAPITYVMPYLPPEVEKMIADYERWNKMPAFVMAFQRYPNACPNCGGIGAVYVRFCASGPHKSPTQRLPVTWFDGNGQFPPGWYTIKETKTYPCSECVKRGER